jgi:hypothetical protein
MAVIVALGLAGCAANETRYGREYPAMSSTKLHTETGDIAVTLSRIITPGEPGALVQEVGWNEYRLKIENRSMQPLTVHDVRLLTMEGRYIDSAETYAEITAPPDPAKVFAEDVARQSAGIAAGQVIPFGGTIVGLVSGVASSMSVQEAAKTKRAFILRRIKNVELAPGGRLDGSAFLPQINNARSLMIDYRAGETDQRLAMPFPDAGAGNADKINVPALW